jgi:ABC-type multidrug transport system fused ATPase/permease subunit
MWPLSPKKRTIKYKGKQMTEIDNIIARARENAKENGDPLDNKKISEYVREEMNECKESYTCNMKDKSTFFSSKFFDFITEIIVKVFLSFIVVLLTFGILGTLINLFSLNSKEATLCAGAIAMLVGFLTFMKQVESMMTEAERSAFSKGIDWQRDKDRFEKALKRLKTD